MLKNKEVAIIGMGPAGVSASIYLKRFALSPICYEKDLIGGKTNYTDKIVNYAGYTLEKGPLLASEFEKQLQKFDIKVNYKMINKVSICDDHFKIYSSSFEKEFDYVVLALGLSMRKLDIKNIDKFMGRGISSCAICDGNFYKNKEVVVYGNGNECLEETLYLSSLCKKVTLIYNQEDLLGIESTTYKIKNSSNIELINKTKILEVEGTTRLEKIYCKNNDGEFSLNVDGMFIYGEMSSFSSLLDFDVERDDKNFIKTDMNMETSVKNLYAIGDYRNTILRQVVTATSDGAICANSIHDKILKE